MTNKTKMALSAVACIWLSTAVMAESNTTTTEKPADKNMTQSLMPAQMMMQPQEPKKLKTATVAEGVEIEASLLKYLKDNTLISPQVEVTSFVATKKQKVGDSALGDDEWYKVTFEATVVLPTNGEPIKAKEYYFINEKSGLISKDLSNYKSKLEYVADIKANLSEDIYTDDLTFLVAGNKDAKHKIVMFVDPLCEICRNDIPELEKFANEHKKDIALFLHAMPLSSYPNSDTLLRIALGMKENGADMKIVYKGLEKVSNETAHNKNKPEEVIAMVAKALGSEKLCVTSDDLYTDKINKIMEKNMKSIEELEIQGTPSMYVDGKFDKMRNGYIELIEQK